MSKRSSFTQITKKPAAKVQLTSLMDALTIILIFLLTNYSDNPQEVEIPKFINLPQLAGKNPAADAKQAVLIAISLNQIQIGKTAEGLSISFNDYKAELDRIVIEYKGHLENAKKNAEAASRDLASASGSEVKKDFKLSIAIQADKGVPYDFIDALMFASNEVGLNYFDFTLNMVDE
jgi:biopolymer transport protein ExbD